MSMNIGVYLPGGSWLDIGCADVFGSPLQAEVSGRMFVPLTGQIELQVLLAELRAQECSKYWNTSCQEEEEEEDKWALPPMQHQFMHLIAQNTEILYHA